MGVHKGRRVSKQKYQIIYRSFVTDIPAMKAAYIAGVNRKTADRYYGMFRDAIIQAAKKERAGIQLSNGVEIDESYFGPRRVRGKRGRGAGKKLIVFGLLKRHDKIYTKVIDSAEKKEVMPIIQSVVSSGSDIYSDGWKSYTALAIYGYNHRTVRHNDNEFARPHGTHINGVEAYWSYVKRRLAMFHGVSAQSFPNHLLESEWRFNHRMSLNNDFKMLLSKLK